MEATRKYIQITDEQILQTLNGEMVEIEGGRNAYTIKFDGTDFIVEVFVYTSVATIIIDETNLRLFNFI